MRTKALQNSHMPSRTPLLWGCWVIATSIPAFLSFLGAGALVTLSITSGGGSASSFLEGDNVLSPICMWATCLILMVGPTLGFAQGLVLRVFIRALPLWPWVLATSFSVTLTFMIYIIPLVGMLMSGAVIGFAQWLVLRHHIQKAEWWVAGGAAAWIAGVLAASYVANGNVLPQDWIAMSRSFPFYPLPSVLYWAIIWGIAVTVYAVLSAAVLTYLLTRQMVTREDALG